VTRQIIHQKNSRVDVRLELNSRFRGESISYI